MRRTKSPHMKRIINHKLSRRNLLKLMAHTVVGAALGSRPIRGVSGQGPAIIKGKTLHYLTFYEFPPPANEEIVKLVGEFSKEAGVKVRIDMMYAVDLQTKITAALAAGVGPDLVRLSGISPHLFGSGLVEVDDLAKSIGERDDGFYEQPISNCKVGQVWKAVPFVIIPLAPAWNLNHLNQIDENPPGTWDEYAGVARKLKEKGFNIGWNLGRELCPTPNFIYPLLWSFGGREFEKDGKTVAIDSQETRKAINFLSSLWEEVGSGDPFDWKYGKSRNMFLSEKASVTVSSAALYFNAVSKAPNVAKNMRYTFLPRGPKGLFHRHITQEHAVLKLSKNPDVAKELIGFLMSPEKLLRFLKANNSGKIGPSKAWETSEMWKSEPALKDFRTIGASGREVGYPGPSSKTAQEILTDFLIIEMFLRVLKGEMKADESVELTKKKLEKASALEC